MYNILNAGSHKVRRKRAHGAPLETTNPDLDPAFYEFYRVACAKYSHFLNTANPSFILSGEGILGLGGRLRLAHRAGRPRARAR